MKLYILFIILMISAFFYCNKNHAPKENDFESEISVPVYRPVIFNVYPHNQDAFTQGLIFYRGYIYESTGLYQQSSLRKVNLESGEVLMKIDLASHYFGEGITIYNDKIIQITWHSKKGFIYDLDSFNLIEEFRYPMEGWGITFDGQYLVLSDGTSILYYLDTESFEIVKQIHVMENDKAISRLNELEYIKGNIYANIWGADRIAIINPDGKVIGWIDLQGILLSNECSEPIEVLNGIAYNSDNDRIYITGKNWCRLFEIECVP